MPDPADFEYDPPQPARPPQALFWLRVMAAVVCLSCLWAVGMMTWALSIGQPSSDHLLWLSVAVVVFLPYSVPLWWVRPRRWHWNYGLFLILPGIVPFTNPLSVTLLVFWLNKRTIAYFRNPSEYSALARPTDGEPEPVAEPAPVADTPPAVLFYVRWLCTLGCVACLLAVPVAVALAPVDPDAGLSGLAWAAGYAAAFGLFVVPLFAPRRRWVWWYAMGLLVLCSLSLYFTLLAVPLLLFWVAKGPRRYFATVPGNAPQPAAL